MPLLIKTMEAEMIKDEQYLLLLENYRKYKDISIASAKSGMSEKTGRKYLKTSPGTE